MRFASCFVLVSICVGKLKLQTYVNVDIYRWIYLKNFDCNATGVFFQCNITTKNKFTLGMCYITLYTAISK